MRSRRARLQEIRAREARGVFPPGSAGARFVSLYRAWLGFGELSSDPDLDSAAPAVRHKVTSDDIAVGSPVELIVLACKSNALRCRALGTARAVTLRTAVRDEVPGAIITVMPTKQWKHARHAYLAGNVLAMRADVEALGLEPLAVHEQGEWDPETEYWGEEGEPIEDWAKPIISRVASGRCSRWSRCFRVPIRTTSTRTPSSRRVS